MITLFEAATRTSIRKSGQTMRCGPLSGTGEIVVGEEGALDPWQANGVPTDGGKGPALVAQAVSPNVT